MVTLELLKNDCCARFIPLSSIKDTFPNDHECLVGIQKGVVKKQRCPDALNSILEEDMNYGLLYRQIYLPLRRDDQVSFRRPCFHHMAHTAAVLQPLLERRVVFDRPTSVHTHRGGARGISQSIQGWRPLQNYNKLRPLKNRINKPQVVKPPGTSTDVSEQVQSFPGSLGHCLSQIWFWHYYSFEPHPLSQMEK